MSTCTVLLSGGIDSAVVASLMRRSGWEPDGLFVDYGQQVIQQERDASLEISAALGLEWREIRTDPLPHAMTSGELQGRNDVLVALAFAHSASDAVAIGIHDGTPYADCAPGHVTRWQRLLDGEYHGRRRLLAPLAEMTKLDAIRLGEAIELPFELTWSCEIGPTACGHCSSCLDREMIHAR